MEGGRKERAEGKGPKGKAGKHSHWSSYLSLGHLDTPQTQFAVPLCRLCSSKQVDCSTLLCGKVQKRRRRDTLRRHSSLHYVIQAIGRGATRRNSEGAFRAWLATMGFVGCPIISRKLCLGFKVSSLHFVRSVNPKVGDSSDLQYFDNYRPNCVSRWDGCVG